MELLIVLGLCFGAYELLGVFQGCFHNEPPLPYQPPLHPNRSSISGSHNDETKEDDEEETDNESDEKRDNVDGDEYLSERKTDKENKSKSGSEARNNTIRRRAEDEVGGLKSIEGQEIDEDEAGPCSCYSTTSEFDEFDDDTKSILRSKQLRRPLAGRKSHPISKFALSSSLMSLNRDDLSLFNYVDAGNSSSSKYSKFRSEAEISETSFNKIISNNLINERRRKKSLSDLIAVNAADRSALSEAAETCYNELNAERSNSTVDSGRKKIFFISAAS